MKVTHDTLCFSRLSQLPSILLYVVSLPIHDANSEHIERAVAYFKALFILDTIFIPTWVDSGALCFAFLVKLISQVQAYGSWWLDKTKVTSLPRNSRAYGHYRSRTNNFFIRNILSSDSNSPNVIKI